MALNIELLESSFKAVSPRAGELADRFYDCLFEQHPELRDRFPEDLAGQKNKLVGSLSLIVGSLRDPDKFGEQVAALGLRHIIFGVSREHYPAVGQILLDTLAELAGPVWNDEVKQTWTDAYQAICGVVCERQNKSAA